MVHSWSLIRFFCSISQSINCYLPGGGFPRFYEWEGFFDFCNDALSLHLWFLHFLARFKIFLHDCCHTLDFWDFARFPWFPVQWCSKDRLARQLLWACPDVFWAFPCQFLHLWVVWTRSWTPQFCSDVCFLCECKGRDTTCILWNTCSGIPFNFMGLVGQESERTYLFWKSLKLIVCTFCIKIFINYQ